MPGQRLFEAVPVAKSSFQERAHGRKDRERRMNKVSSVGRIGSLYRYSIRSGQIIAEKR